MGSFEEKEKQQSVSHGEAAVIRAPRIASFPRPQVTWFRDGRKIPPSSRIAITLENTLVILSTVAPDAGRYYVQAVNDKNGDNKTSQPIMLTVENVGGPADPIAPTIIIPPCNTSVISGTSEVTLECVANASFSLLTRPLIKLHIIWKKGGIPVSSGISDYNRRLTILNPSLSDSGYYECEAVLRSSSVPSVVRGAYLSVLEPPQFTKEPERHITAEMEKVVQIPCQAKGVPPPSMFWYKDAVLLGMEKLARFKLLANGSLQISGLMPDDTGMFQCFARNAAGEVQSSTYLAVTTSTRVTAHHAMKSPFSPAGERILASGSVQLPRFTLLESGSLLISPSRISDAGSYTCLATNSRGVDEASAELIVWARTRITNPPQDQSVIKGTKASMTCGVTHDPNVLVRYMWEKDGTIVNTENMPRMRLDTTGTLHIAQTWSGDIGTYTCHVISAGGNDSHSAHLRVRQLPHAPENPIARLSAVEKRAINLTWTKPFDGNSPLLRYILEVSENNAPWTVLMASVDPEVNSVLVRGLVPARSYQFRLCAVNDVGKGQFSKDTERLLLPEEPPTAPPQNVIASGRTNQSIMIQWQPPPENHQNGILKGYIIRFCLAGLPVGYQFRNISNADVNNLLLEDLIIWTNYEIEVAAYNSAGLGVYSARVTEWTLQGVPTVSPGNVQAEATNSTTIRFTWNPPSPQFVNGINQGYKLIAWEPVQEEDMTVVTVRPNFQDNIHVGYISGLKKFTEYFTSVLCFTTPGDGPRSPPQLVRTHEDVPGPVGHLSFNEILDTSLKVSWQEPLEKNGILTGYRISWEEYNRTNTRVTHYLPNVTLEYRVTGLTALTTYTIEVAAMTSKGQGQVSSSTISSGVPPELPGSPTNLGISNIGPRSVTLQFRPGYDGKTSISRWQVEVQMGHTGENEEWLLIHQLSNEPEARSMEVPNLNPYTYYSFRMRQVNIVGTSPPSLSSRRIQTLQAPPDVSPANITVRTASETSLWLRWMPLPESEYNGSPESVGYRLRYSRLDGRSHTLTNTIHDRVEREFTIEDLEEWTEYRIQVQAFNAIMYKEKDSDSRAQFWLVEGNASRSAQLIGLGKYVLYEIRVLAFTRIGDGVPSNPPILERTLDDVPGPPVGILFPEVRITSVRLIWQPPAAPNGIILANVEVLSPSARQFTATNLRPESTYLFRITAQTRKGWGEAAEALVVTTEKRDRPQPPSKPIVLQEDVKARNVLLSWEPGSDGLSPVRYYTVQTRELPDGKWVLHSASVKHNTTSFIVNRLKPFTTYKFRVKATNDIGDSEYSEESESLTTLQAAPDEAPTILSVTPHTTTSVLIRWQAPSEDKINGILLGFRIRYRELPYEGVRGFIARSVGSPNARWTELTPTYAMRNLSEASLTQYELDNLNKHRRYEIRMSVYNAVGEGPTSSPQEVFVGEAESGVKLKNLTGYTSYLISILAFNAAGDGPRSIPIKGRTQQAGVSKIVTVDVKGNSPLWLKVKDLSEGVTYRFRIRAKTFIYGPEVEANITTGPGEGAPGPPGEPFISRYGSAITIHWSSGDPGKGPITRYVIEARPSDEGLWDILIKDIPKEVTSYTFSMDILKQGVSYDFRVIAVNDYGYGTPSSPSPSVSAQKANPFYEEWWFLVVIALVGLIFILLLVFVLIIRGQSKKYAKKSDSGSNSKSNALSHGEMVSLDESSFPALELNNRRMSVKNSFCRKNGIYTRYQRLSGSVSVSLLRSPPRPSPGSLHYSDEDVTKYNDLIPAESSSLTEKPSEISDSQVSHARRLEGEKFWATMLQRNHQKAHSFVNHYISDPTYYNSWRRQQKGISRAQAYSYTESDSGDPDHCPMSNSTSTQQGSLFRPKPSRTPTPQTPVNPPSQQSTLYRPPSSLAPGSRAPIAGFSSFV
ncbi:Protein sidekick-2, partial [Ophiophagus hannah]